MGPTQMGLPVRTAVGVITYEIFRGESIHLNRSSFNA